MQRQLTRGLVLAAALVMSAACQELDVPNLNDPDRTRALANPGDVVTFAGSAFNQVFVPLQDPSSGSVFNHTMNYSTLFTTTTNTWSIMQEMDEPRRALDNDPSISVIGPQGPRFLWRNMLVPASIPYDVLNLMEDGMVLLDPVTNEDISVRTRAMLKLIQGWMWGYLGVMYDQAPVFHESVPFSTDAHGQMRDIMTPYPGVITAAVTALQEAATIASQNTFSFPAYPESTLWFGTPTPVTNTDLVQLANTLSARFLVLAARTPAQRKAVNWQQVLTYTAAGLTKDFEVSIASGFRSSEIYSTARSNTGSRWDMRLLGHADQSGAYQAWIAAPNAEKNRFNITTPDRRITGAGGPTTAGSYTRYRTDNSGFDAAFGTRLFSAYQWHRHAAKNGISATSGSTASNVGTAILASVDENRLLRAEALIYTGQLQAAADLINVTRTRATAALPPVTTAGATGATCVPRTDSGACGDLMAALWWERMIENATLDTMYGWADGRAFGLFVEGSYVHFPMPGNEADVVGIPFYTFGGVGTEWGATYAPITMSNVQ